MKPDAKRFRKFMGTCAAIVFGNCLMAVAVAAFIIPHDIITGGATGVGIVLGRFLSVDPAIIILIFNLLALALGGIVLGKRFLVTTAASSILYPTFLGMAQRIPGIEAWTKNPMLAALFGGGIIGISLGMVMRMGSSTGGTDVINLVLHKWLHLPVSVMLYATDIVIIGGQTLLSETEPLFYGIVLLVVESFVLDQVLLLGQSQIQVFVVSSRYNDIRRGILTDLQAGATMVCIETGMTNQSQRGVLCIIPSPRKLYAATELIHSIDPTAFLTVTQIKEVRGQGFTLERSPKKQD